MKKILVLDDDTSITEIFEIILARAGFAVSILNNGEALLEGDFIEPDLFIIDKQLRGIDGLDICKYLKNRPQKPLTPIIVISASNKVESIAKTAGADDFLEKPFKAKSLIGLIQKHLLTPGRI